MSLGRITKSTPRAHLTASPLSALGDHRHHHFYVELHIEINHVRPSRGNKYLACQCHSTGDACRHCEQGDRQGGQPRLPKLWHWTAPAPSQPTLMLTQDADWHQWRQKEEVMLTVCAASGGKPKLLSLTSTPCSILCPTQLFPPIPRKKSKCASFSEAILWKSELNQKYKPVSRDLLYRNLYFRKSSFNGKLPICCNKSALFRNLLCKIVFPWTHTGYSASQLCGRFGGKTRRKEGGLEMTWSYGSSPQNFPTCNDSRAPHNEIWSTTSKESAWANEFNKCACSALLLKIPMAIWLFQDPDIKQLA
jgi:hypothetical protein